MARYDENIFGKDDEDLFEFSAAEDDLLFELQPELSSEGSNSALSSPLSSSSTSAKDDLPKNKKRKRSVALPSYETPQKEDKNEDIKDGQDSSHSFDSVVSSETPVSRTATLSVSSTGTRKIDMSETAKESSIRKMMRSYFLEYASYVIKDRAIPELDDGLKPVQRRILYSLYEMDDGKLHKVANVVGNTMKYHPHGDASIYEALVHMANFGYLIDRQGNFGNIFTGDPPSAARYIECRLSKLAREVLFNKEITQFVPTYDGRNLEPVTLPAKIPLLLLQGAEGIAVGMATRILPHNFQELLKAQIQILKGEPFEIYPDFQQGGLMDVSEYNKGNGKIKLRAKIEIVNDKTLVIREIPATLTTEQLIQSIEEAAQKGKIKIAQINDYTSDKVEIEIKLPRNIYAEQTKAALYAYTSCEVSIPVNCLVIDQHQPREMDVHQILVHNTFKLKEDLYRELEIELGHLEDQYHGKTLMQIFIENRIYKEIEEAFTQEEIFSKVREGLQPYLHLLVTPRERILAEQEKRSPNIREVTNEDIEKLLQIPIRKISRFDIEKNRQDLDEIVEKVKKVLHQMKHITKYTIHYIEGLLKEYGPLYPRKTQITTFTNIDVRKIALSNVRVGWDRQNGYLGTQVKSDYVIQCTEHDRLVIFKREGICKVLNIQPKAYIGAAVAVEVFNPNKCYSLVYRDKKTGKTYAKRFRIGGIIVEKEYPLAKGNIQIEKLFDRQGVVLECTFEPLPRQKEKSCIINFDEIPERSRSAGGLLVTSKKIVHYLQVKRGSSVQEDDGNESHELQTEVVLNYQEQPTHQEGLESNTE